MINNKNITISANDVKDFKVTYCDENAIIKDLLKKEFLSYFEEPIMDVGGGTADILSEVIPDKKVVHLDVLDFSDVKIPLAHKRITGDFFDTQLMKSLMPINTLFMSHVQQFIDGDLDRLRSAIAEIGAKRIILIEDVNNDFLGDVMRFSLANFSNANPEIKIDGFPYGYKKVKSISFTATLISPTFLELTKQCLYLMDLTHSEENLSRMFEFLQKNLSKPKFTINQEINVYDLDL
ncbi:MAG: hypothetical protein KBF62_02295 [Candidatus Pacebacteria bacterium]|nr:hypothetical protein [Candidatus Paceibacterota bacterium]MBP9058447.1 hypothetical protein [Candidatus Paceibacterota bacterium]MBP9770447.1 hypothetical protein [Candidatus Paceibacterota bacterium]